jgi:5'-3' exonuclease
LYENIVKETPEKIANYVIFSGTLSLFDEGLESIGPNSVAYYLFEGDKKGQNALLKQYVNNLILWYDAQEIMLEKLQNTQGKSNTIKQAINILEKRMVEIQEYRNQINDFESQIFENK